MRNCIKVFILTVAFLCCPIGVMGAETLSLSERYDSVITDIAENSRYQKTGFILSADILSTVGSSENDFLALMLSRYGYPDNSNGYFASAKAYVTNAYVENGMLHRTKAQEYSRFALSVGAMGGNVEAFGTDAKGNAVNLLSDGVYECLIGAPWESKNILGAIWGLIAFQSKDYTMPKNAVYTEKILVEEILKKQQTNGGFALKSGTADISTTALALMALSDYRGISGFGNVETALSKGLSYLSSAQKSGGDFGDTETTSYVLMALCDLSINPAGDQRFIKEGHSVLDGLGRYYQEKEVSFGTSSDTAIGGLALVAYYRYVHGLRSIFDFREESAASDNVIMVVEASIHSLPQVSGLTVEKEYATVAHQYYLLNETDRKKIKNAEKLLNGLAEIQAMQAEKEPKKDTTGTPTSPPSSTQEKETVENTTNNNSNTTDQTTAATKKSTSKTNSGTKKQSSTNLSGASARGGSAATVSDGGGSATVTTSNTERHDISDFPQGMVEASYFSAIQSSDKNLILSGMMEEKFPYSFAFHGTDIATPMPFSMRVTQNVSLVKKVKEVAENPFVFSIYDPMPGEALFTISDLPIDDGETLLFSYEEDTKEVSLVEKLTLENGTVSFVLEKGGCYFIADRAKVGAVAMTTSKTTDTAVGSQGIVGMAVGILCGCIAFVLLFFLLWKKVPWVSRTLSPITRKIASIFKKFVAVKNKFTPVKNKPVSFSQTTSPVISKTTVFCRRMKKGCSSVVGSLFKKSAELGKTISYFLWRLWHRDSRYQYPLGGKNE